MASDCKWDGSLSPSDFRAACEALCERWKGANPNLPQWMWISCPTLPSTVPSCKVEGYMSLANIYYCRTNEEHLSEENCPVQEDTDDNAILVLDEDQHMHSYEFHIVYSFSYRVPVLYFRGYKRDGQPLEMNHIENDFPLYSSNILRESKWTYITYEEHPILHRPWFMLHPCGTSEWMKILFGDTKCDCVDVSQYLPSWLSVVGQAVGLRVPIEMKSGHLVHSA